MNDAAIIVTIGVGTYLLRLSFIGIIGDRTMPDWAMVPLRFVEQLARRRQERVSHQRRPGSPTADVR